MVPFKNDQDLLRFIRERLYVASVCDILDEMGYRNQAMHHRVRPVLPAIRACGFVGRARTFKWESVSYPAAENGELGLLDAFDSLSEGEVIVHSTDPECGSATWDSVLSAVSQVKGIAGCVCDGLVRHTNRIIEMGFPVYHAGISPVSFQRRRKLIACDVPVHCGSVKVDPGDLIYADFDGIVVIPSLAQAILFEKASEKVESENRSRKELLQGKSLREVYNKYKSL